MPLRGFAARGLIVVTAVIAIVVAGLTSGTRPSTTVALPTSEPERVTAAAMQQAVLNPNNNTLYVLDVFGAAVDAREPATNDLKTRIAVGGKPTALALYESANTILVLDASQKKVTEIDARTNTVIGATTVEIAGTPTSISVDPNAGKILVTTESRPSSPAEKSPTAGTVAVINGSTKQLETVREIEVAPRLVVPDPNRSRTALVSPNATTIVDSSYKVIDTLPGGVSAAFSRRGDTIAVLSASGTGSVLKFNGPGARDDIKFDGTPRAMTALPDGGYLVFVAAGDLGHVTRIGQDGSLVGTVEIAITNGDLLYDQSTNRFTVASAGRLFSAEMPTQVAAAAAQSASPSPADSSTTAVSPSTPPTVAAARTSDPSVAPASPNANLLSEAHPLGGNLYSLPLPNDIRPQFVTTSGSRIWILDQSNGVHSFDSGTGDLFGYGKLRGGAHVEFWVASASYVYGVDATNGEVNVVDVARQRIDAYATNVLSPVSAVAVGLDGKLWIGLRDAQYLLVFDPTTRLMRTIDLGPARISALTVDSIGRVLYADDFRGTVGVIDQTTKLLNEVGFAKRGTTTALLVDSNSTMWLGTSAGEVYSIRGGTARLAVSVQRPVTSFTVDRAGRTWYLAPLPSGFGYIYAPTDGSQAARSVPGPVISLTFNAQGRALLADPRGAIYMSTEGAQ